MAKLEIFIYKPHLYQASRINPDACFTLKGQNYHEWQRDRQTLYDYKVEMIKRKLNRKPKQKVYDFWR